MIIVAKFSSMCPKCGQSIDPGSKVEWSKGSKASHVTCPSARGTARGSSVTSRPKILSAESAPYERVEKWKPCKRVYLPNTVGKVRVANGPKWATLRRGAVGDPPQDGQAFVVVGQTERYESAEDNEDMGDCSGAGWVVTLHLRRATLDEAGPALERAAKKKADREAAARREQERLELKQLCEAGLRASDDAAKLPAGREVVVDPGVHGGRTIAILSEDGGGVAWWCGGYYDNYRPTLAITRDPRAVEILQGWLAGGQS